MSKASQNANTVLYAVEQVCGLYGVDALRMQSRVVTVAGAAGRMRPMFFGQWVDRFGKRHASGMADLLLRPRVPLRTVLAEPKGAPFEDLFHTIGKPTHITVPLWVECKSGAGRVTEDQVEFKNHVEQNGEHWLLIHDDVRPLIEWLESRGVAKLPKGATGFVTEG